MDLMDTKDVIDIRHQTLSSPQCKVHKGFHSQFFSIENFITQDIKDIITSYKIDEISFSGHSLGGALAIIASPFYGEMVKKQMKLDNIRISTYSFGTVSVGNLHFLKWFLENVTDHYRIENKKDIIPFVPVHPTFVHLPNRYVFKDNGIVETSVSSQVQSSQLLRFLINKDLWTNGLNSIFKDHACESYVSNIRSALIRESKSLKM
jgi:hypothetical protein